MLGEGARPAPWSAIIRRAQGRLARCVSGSSADGERRAAAGSAGRHRAADAPDDGDLFPDRPARRSRGRGRARRRAGWRARDTGRIGRARRRRGRGAVRVAPAAGNPAARFPRTGGRRSRRRAKGRSTAALEDRRGRQRARERRRGRTHSRHRAARAAGERRGFDSRRRADARALRPRVGGVPHPRGRTPGHHFCGWRGSRDRDSAADCERADGRAGDSAAGGRCAGAFRRNAADAGGRRFTAASQPWRCAGSGGQGVSARSSCGSSSSYMRSSCGSHSTISP